MSLWLGSAEELVPKICHAPPPPGSTSSSVIGSRGTSPIGVGKSQENEMEGRKEARNEKAKRKVTTVSNKRADLRFGIESEDDGCGRVDECRRRSYVLISG